jgi:hypothetical protein
MPIPDEIEWLLVELSASLSPPRYSAFHTAARAALAGIPCLGVGLAYRVLADLQRAHWDPPPSGQADAIPRHYFARSKLRDRSAIAVNNPRTGGHARRRVAG